MVALLPPRPTYVKDRRLKTKPTLSWTSGRAWDIVVTIIPHHKVVLDQQRLPVDDAAHGAANISSAAARLRFPSRPEKRQSSGGVSEGQRLLSEKMADVRRDLPV